MVDILDIVERIIDIELQLGTLAKLEPDLLRKLIAVGLGEALMLSIMSLALSDGKTDR